MQKNIKYGKLFQQSKIAFLKLIFERFFFICCFRDIFLLHFLLQSLPYLGYLNGAQASSLIGRELLPICINQTTLLCWMSAATALTVIFSFECKFYFHLLHSEYASEEFLDE